MILFEICKDLIEIQRILGGIFDYDSVYQISQQHDNFHLLEKNEKF